MRAKEFVRSLNKKGSLSIGEDVVTVDPIPRLCSGFLVPGIGVVFQWAYGEDVWKSELAR